MDLTEGPARGTFHQRDLPEVTLGSARLISYESAKNIYPETAINVLPGSIVGLEVILNFRSISHMRSLFFLQYPKYFFYLLYTL